MENPKDIADIRIITVSGRIASGSTTLAKHLAKKLGWKHLEGGEIFWEAVRKKLGLDPKETDLRPDAEDRLFDAQLKKILLEDHHIVLETKLAAFNAQDVPGIYKILVVCDDEHGVDQAQIRIDRLVNREALPVDQAKAEVLEREANDIEKWRKLYADNDPDWVYWNSQYYDLVVNTFTHNQESSMDLVLQNLDSLRKV
jgi:cytidylate kinase